MKRFVLSLGIAALLGLSGSSLAAEMSKRPIFECDCTSPEGCVCERSDKDQLSAIGDANQSGEEVILIVKRGSLGGALAEDQGGSDATDLYAKNGNGDGQFDSLTAAKNKKGGKKQTPKSLMDLIGCEVEVKIKCSRK